MIRLFAKLLSRLSVSRKLLLIYLLDLSAVIFISAILINEKFIAIDFARKEVAGNAYIAEARNALLHAALPTGALVSSDFMVDAAHIRSAEQQWGDGMDSAQASGALGDTLRRLSRAQLDRASEKEIAALRREAIDRGRVLITRIGNQSNLILDPDLDSYYTMSVVLLRNPELLELVAHISAHIEQEAAINGPYSADARTRYLNLEGRLTATARGIESDYGEAFSAATDVQLKRTLEVEESTLMARINAFRAAGQGILEIDESPERLAAFERARADLLITLDHAWTVSGLELDRLLHERIHAFFMRMWLHLGTALSLLLMLLTAVFFVARQIALPLQRLAEVADTVRRTGDRTLRASWNSDDEIGRLVLGFNGMLEQLERERQTQQELASAARAAQAQQQLLEAMPIPMVVTAVPGHEVLHANAQAHAWLQGRDSDPWAAGLEPSLRARFFQELADKDAVDEFEVSWRASREPTWSLLSARQVVYQGQSAVLTAFTPINHLKLMEQRLELWAKVFEASSEGILIVDDRRRILTVNSAFCRHTAYDAAEVIGEHPGFLLAPAQGANFFDTVWPAADKRGSWQGEVILRRRSDSTYPAWLVVSAVRDASARVTHYICASLDITERKANEERIRFLAHHDALTGLPNRLLFIERLRLAMQHAKRHEQKVAVLFIDLDRFKTINDSLGHHVGDELLRSVSARLLQGVRTGDTVSRLGGDEFVVALGDVADCDEVTGIVERRIAPLIREVHHVDGAELHVACSIGIAIFPDDSRDIDELMRHADVAMYQAKALGRDSAQFFTPELNERAHKRLRVESHLRHAIDRGELALHYQPRIGAASGELMSVEALLRWRSPELGNIAPGEFIPIAEEARLIVPIGAWVMAEACRQQAQWKAQGLGEIPISINMSAMQLRDPALVDTLRGTMARYGVNPAAIELELTESMLMETINETLAQLHALKRLGVKLSVDDFGTGYSSLNYLNRFPIDRLKIDRSFVRDVLEDSTDLTITIAIIGLGHALGLQVVAEGVESEGVAEVLRGARCDELQGYHFARPLSAAALETWILKSSRRRGRLTAAST